MSDGTYGGIQRTHGPNQVASYYTEAKCGALTLEMLNDAFKRIEEHDRESERLERGFYAAMRPFQRLLTEKDYLGYVAAYRLIRACFYSECALHSKNYAEYVAILTERGLWPISLDSTSR